MKLSNPEASMRVEGMLLDMRQRAYEQQAELDILLILLKLSHPQAAYAMLERLRSRMEAL